MKKRAYGIFLGFCGMIFVLIIYLGWLSQSNPALSAGTGQGRYTITAATVRGTIYDRAMRPLVNQEKEYRAALLPSSGALTALRPSMERQSYLSLVNKLSGGSPAIARLTGPAASAEGLALFHIPVRYGVSVPAPHLIGYLDGGEQAGVTGLEAAYNEVLERYRGEATATFSVNGAGTYLVGDPAEVHSTVENARGGIVTSLDREIQVLTEQVIGSMSFKGAVVILEPESGDLLACANAPTFHPEAVAESIQKQDGSLVNRAFSLYDCGSVFKIVTAAAALEKGISPGREYACNGWITVSGTRFHCHQRSLGHQTLTMTEAFAASCNVYFIQLAQEVGGAALLQMAEKLGLTEKIVLADTLVAPACVFPTVTELSVPATLANFSFGQGKLLLSPLHVARMTAAIANDGVLPEVSLVIGTVNEAGVPKLPEGREGERVLSEGTTAALQTMMKMVVESGTGRKAQPDGVTAAGKTGTAETGQYTGETPVVQSWFTGYFPAENPRFVITVLAEDADTYDSNAAEVFCEISNKLIEQKKE